MSLGCSCTHSLSSCYSDTLREQSLLGTASRALSSPDSSSRTESSSSSQHQHQCWECGCEPREVTFSCCVASWPVASDVWQMALIQSQLRRRELLGSLNDKETLLISCFVHNFNLNKYSSKYRFENFHGVHFSVKTNKQ